MAQQQRKPPLPNLPICLDPICGYLHAGGHHARAIFDAHGTNRARPWQERRLLFHYVAPSVGGKLRQEPVASNLQQQLEQAISGLVDEEVDDVLFKTISRDEQPATSLDQNNNSQQQQERRRGLSWRDKVRVQDVEATGPGSRAYQPQRVGQKQLQAVAPLVDFAKWDLIGFYLVS